MKMTSHCFLVVILFSLSLAAGEVLFELGCVNDQQCKHFERPNVNVSCIKGHCKCLDIGSNAGTVECTPQDVKVSNFIGGSCPCQLPKSECKEEQNICYCAQGYVASADKRRCLEENVHLGEKCEMDKQCHSADYYAVCDVKHKICTCQQNFTANNGTCVSVADPVTICHNDSDCSTLGSNVICLKESQQCICNKDHVKAKNKAECLPLVEYQESCTEDQQCLKKLGPGGSCISGSCECRDKHYVVQKQITEDSKNLKPQVVCTRIIEIGEYCYDDKDCYKHQLPNEEQTMSCLFSECNCKWGYNSINNTECVKGSDGSSKSYSLWTALIVAAIAIGL